MPTAGPIIGLADDFDAVIIAVEDVSEQNALTMAAEKKGWEARVADGLIGAMVVEDHEGVGLVITDDLEIIPILRSMWTGPKPKFLLLISERAVSDIAVSDFVVRKLGADGFVKRPFRLGDEIVARQFPMKWED